LYVCLHHDDDLGKLTLNDDALARSMATIPEEFLRIKKSEEDDELNLESLFEEKDSNEPRRDEIDSYLVNVEIAGRSYKLRQPPDKGSLFAHQVWSGSRLLARYIAEEGSDLVKNRATIEFGAGTALPSLVALSCGTKMTIITDYPDDDVIQALRETVGHNWNVVGRPLGRVAVVGHEWGQSIDEIARAVHRLQGGIEIDTRETGETRIYFDVAFLSECLWNHKLHKSLAKSLDSLLHPVHGIAIVTYAHHFPGLEKEDDGFFLLCEEEYGMISEHVKTEPMAYMWDETKTKEIHLTILKRK
jgi:nicotinamide N-methyltransferase